MPFNFFHPKPDAFGGIPAFLDLDPIGRSGRTLATAGSTTYVIPTPYRKFYVRRCSAHATSVVGTSGSTVATVQRVSSGTGTPVSLTNALWLENMANKVTSNFAMSTTATDANRTIAEGDVLQVQVINVTGIDNQPVDMYVNVEVLILE